MPGLNGTGPNGQGVGTGRGMGRCGGGRGFAGGGQCGNRRRNGMRNGMGMQNAQIPQAAPSGEIADLKEQVLQLTQAVQELSRKQGQPTKE